MRATETIQTSIQYSHRTTLYVNYGGKKEQKREIFYVFNMYI